MTQYRVYCFDGASRIIRADWIAAPDDEQALSSAHEFDGCFRKEIWDRERLVGRIDFRSERQA